MHATHARLSFPKLRKQRTICKPNEESYCPAEFERRVGMSLQRTIELHHMKVTAQREGKWQRYSFEIWLSTALILEEPTLIELIVLLSSL